MENIARFDIYRVVHKALRALMAEALSAIGRVDALDDEATAQVLARVRTLLGLLRGHVEHENDFIHMALETRRPGSSARTADDHAHHLGSIATLEALLAQTESAPGAARVEAAHRLYQQLALFVAENFVHMQAEETDNNRALWAAYTDAELIDIQNALVASISPQELAELLPRMASSATPIERATLLADVQRKVPAEVFSRLLESVRPHLTAREWDKLVRALAPLPLAA
jgi:hypothetical protein